MDIFDDLKFQIAEFSTIPEIISSCMVDKDWNKVCERRDFWEMLIKRDYDEDTLKFFKDKTSAEIKKFFMKELTDEIKSNNGFDISEIVGEESNFIGEYLNLPKKNNTYYTTRTLFYSALNMQTVAGSYRGINTVGRIHEAMIMSLDLDVRSGKRLDQDYMDKLYESYGKPIRLNFNDNKILVLAIKINEIYQKNEIELSKCRIIDNVLH
jgi:hypothetical protein